VFLSSSFKPRIWYRALGHDAGAVEAAPSLQSIVMATVSDSGEADDTELGDLVRDRDSDEERNRQVRDVL